MKPKARVVIAEDHTIVREGLRVLLSSDEEFEVVGLAEDGRQAVRYADSLSPDVIVMDLSMPGMHGLEAIREIRRRNPDTRLLVLTIHKDEECILAAFQAGANGYVLKDATPSELITATKTVLKGKSYISPSVSEMVIEGFVEGRTALKQRSSLDTLTPREREILKLVGEGHKNREIADILCISVRTAEKHRTNLMKKLDLHSVSALTALALEKGLISR